MRTAVLLARTLVLVVPFAWPGTPAALAAAASPAANLLVVSSPSGQISATFLLLSGRPCYQVDYKRSQVVGISRMGFRLKDAPTLAEGFRIARSRRNSGDETWEQPWGEQRRIRNHFNQLIVELEETGAPGRRMNVVFRAYDDGVAFRFEFPRQDGLGSFQIADELTEFALSPDDQAWWIPALRVHRYEYLYGKSRVADLGAVHTPLTIETRKRLFVSIHEAALIDYAAMTLQSAGGGMLRCDLVPWSDGVKVKATTPFLTPWRTIQIADKPGDLIVSYLALNLNEPSRISDTSWIKPGKYVGIWWGMHLNIWTWASGPNHGATTERATSYIDFAAKHGFAGVLVEGWNIGWDGNWPENGDTFSFTKPYPDFDLEAVARYAADRGVTLIGHHETAYGIDNYERQLEDAFALYERLGVRVVKTGYVDEMAARQELHHGQYMVRHYARVVEAAARHHIMVDVHEPIKDTGIRRSWPNMMTREGARGMEYNAWSADGGNPPEHETILPFTRLLAGPMDFTPGILDLTLESAHRPAGAAGTVQPRVNTTLAKALANYVVIYSPQHMAADLIENYEGQPAFEFIKDVPTDWDETRVLNGKIGDYVTIVRKDRRSDDWYLGSVTDEFARTFDVALSFLDSNREYVARIYADAINADWETKPKNMTITERPVDSRTVLTIRLAPGGGQAIRIRPAK
jgi:alpha-glucosidase